MLVLLLVLGLLSAPSQAAKTEDPCKGNACDQICTAVGASYTCTCRKGYRLAGDNYTCLEEADESGFLLLQSPRIHTTNIRQLALNGTYQFRDFTLKSKATGHILAYDEGKRNIYYWDNGTKQVLRSRLDGSGKEIFLVNVHASCIAIDPASRNLYLADPHRTSLLVASLDIPNNTFTLPVEDISYKTKLLVDTKLGKLFWSEFLTIEGRPVCRIESSNLDGTQRKTHIQHPPIQDFTIDSNAKILYWITFPLTSLEQGQIGWFNLTNGDNGTIHVPTPAMRINKRFRRHRFAGTEILALAAHGSALYLSAIDRTFGSYVESANLTGIRLRPGAKVKLRFQKIATSPPQNMGTSLVVVSPQDSNRNWSVCWNRGNCSQICLPTHTGGARCVCGDHYKLEATNGTCIYIPGSENRSSPSFDDTCPDLPLLLYVDECGGTAFFNFTEPTASDSHGPVRVTSKDRNPANLSVGIHVFKYTATGITGKTAHCIIEVTVEDIECERETTSQVTDNIELASTTASSALNLTLQKTTKGRAVAGGWIAFIVISLLLLISGTIFTLFRYRQGNPRLHYFLYSKDYDSLLQPMNGEAPSSD